MIRINRGPFAGVFGWLARSSGQRVSVVIENRGRQLHVELSLEWIDAIGNRRRAASSVERPEIQRRRSI